MPVQFQSHSMHDYGGPQTVENSFRAYANYAGIHDFNFNRLYSLAAADWSAASGVTATFGSDSITLDASTIPAAWYTVLQTRANLPHEVLIKYHKTQHRQGVVVRYLESTGEHFLATTDDNGYPTILKSSASGYVTVMQVPRSTPQEADVMVAFRQMRFSDAEDDVWHSISVWMNDALVITHTEYVGSVITGSVRFGLAVYGGTSRTYTNVEIPEITDFAEWSSIDPGEEPMGGLQRSIEGRYLRFFARFNGALRAWKAKATAVVKTLTNAGLDEKQTHTDKRVLYTHVRQVGAYTQAEFVRPDLFKKFQHRFTELNNPFLMNVEDCYREAERSIQRMEEQATTQTFGTEATPLLEPEDHIANDDGEWIITSRSFSLTRGRIKQTLNVRKYIYGS